MKKTTTTATFFKRGKMVFCLRTHQIFPSATVAAKELGVNYYTVAKACEGKKPNTKGLFYVESIADIDKLFAQQNAKAKAEAEAKAKAARELEELNAELAKLEQLKSELAKKASEIKKKLN